MMRKTKNNTIIARLTKFCWVPRETILKIREWNKYNTSINSNIIQEFILSHIVSRSIEDNCANLSIIWTRNWWSMDFTIMELKDKYSCNQIWNHSILNRIDINSRPSCFRIYSFISHYSFPTCLQRELSKLEESIVKAHGTTEVELPINTDMSDTSANPTVIRTTINYRNQ